MSQRLTTALNNPPEYVTRLYQSDMQQYIIKYLKQVCKARFGSAQKPTAVNPPSTGRFNECLFFCLDGRDMLFRMAPPENQGFLFYERNMMAQEPDIHKTVREKTGIPAAEILVYDDSRQFAPRPYIIMERLPGLPLSQAMYASASKIYGQVGEYLRDLHQITTDKYGYLGAHKPMEPADCWVDAFEIMWNKLLDDIVDCDGYTSEEAEQFRKSFHRNRSLFDRPVKSSLLHMDIWAENILVDDTGDVSGIVDWDRALWGDPEIEFAVLDYCGVSIPSFWRGYGRERDTSPKARSRGIYYYLYELQKYIVIERARRDNKALADRYKNAALRIAEKI